jgi:DNA-binding transcriptional regulator YdaS (Cro superfamily)
MDSGLRLVLEAVGTRYRLSKLLGLTTTATQNWDRVPLNRILDVERVTGVPREKLRPELYR